MVPRKKVSLVRRVNSTLKVVAARVEVVPVDGVRETPVIVPAKDRRESPEEVAGGVAFRTRTRVPLPGGNVVPLGGPLHELSEDAAKISRVKKPRERTGRFIGHPMPERENLVAK